MESVFKDPKQVKEMIVKGMQDKLDEGELEQLEFAEIEKAMEPSTAKKTTSSSKVQLRGEGGSGELKHPQIAQVPEVSPIDKVSHWEEGVEASQQGDWQEEREEEEASAATRLSDQVSQIRQELGNLRAYIEDQMGAMSAIIAPIQTRLQRLEAGQSASVPLAPLGRAHMRTQSGSASTSPPRPATKSGVGVPRLGSTGPTITKAPIETFLSRNPDYPSLAAIRKAKLRQLQATMGLSPIDLTVGVADWVVGRIYELLVKAHEQE
jgi:hypothetical protein